MNKKQLVAKISSTLGQSKADAERTFDSITTIILDALKKVDILEHLRHGVMDQNLRQVIQMVLIGFSKWCSVPLQCQSYLVR